MKKHHFNTRLLACLCAFALLWTAFVNTSSAQLLRAAEVSSSTTAAISEAADTGPSAAESGTDNSSVQYISPKTNQSGANAEAPVFVPGSASFLLDPRGKSLPFGQGLEIPLEELDIKSSKILVRVLDNKNPGQYSDLLSLAADQRIYPASMTKLMTVLPVLEALNEGRIKPEQTESVYWSDLEGLYEQDASVIGLEFAEDMSVKDLLYGALLASGGDAAQTLTHALSEHLFAYTDLMNKKAKALGLKATNFANVTGLSDPKNYSSLNDIAVILQECLKYPLFKEITAVQDYTSAPSEDHPEGIKMRNTLYRYMDELGESIHYIQGGKTGFINESRYSLASFHSTGDRTYLIVSSGAEESGQNVLDHEKIYRYLLEPAGPYQLLNKGDLLRTLPIEGGESLDSIKITLAKDLIAKVAPAASLDDFKVTLSLPDKLKAPMGPSDAIGLLTVSQKIAGQEQEIYRQVLSPGIEVKQSRLAYVMEFAPVYAAYVFAVLFLGLLIFLVIRSFNKKAPSGGKKPQQRFEDFEG